MIHSLTWPRQGIFCALVSVQRSFGEGGFGFGEGEGVGPGIGLNGLATGKLASVASPHMLLLLRAIIK